MTLVAFDEKQASDILKNTDRDEAIRNDAALRNLKRADLKAAREGFYNEILDTYTSSLKDSVDCKKTYRKTTFRISCVLLVAFPALVLFLFVTKKTEDLVQWFSVIIPALVSFLTVFIVIPKIITEYLFNAEEEKYMSDIIQHIQDYDSKQE